MFEVLVQPRSCCVSAAQGLHSEFWHLPTSGYSGVSSPHLGIQPALVHAMKSYQVLIMKLRLKYSFWGEIIALKISLKMSWCEL